MNGERKSFINKEQQADFLDFAPWNDKTWPKILLEQVKIQQSDVVSQLQQMKNSIKWCGITTSTDGICMVVCKC